MADKESLGRFPIFIDISCKRVVVVGGGKIAARRVGVLRAFAKKIFVVAPEISTEIRVFSGIEWAARPFESTDIQGAHMVLAATDSRSLNHKIFQLCRENRVPVNVCDCKDECDFFFPAIFSNDRFVGGLISKNGSDHRGVKEKAAEIRDFLGREDSL